VREGYDYGRFGYLEVLDAQRTMVELRFRHVDALSRYHHSVVWVESLIGKAFAETGDSDTKAEKGNRT